MADQTNPSTPNPIKNGDHPSTSVGNNANQSLIGSQNTSNVPIQIPLNVAILAPTQNVAAALPPRPTSIVSNLRKASDISPISSGSPTMNQRGRPVTGEGRNVSWGEQPEALQAEIEIEFQKQAERQHRYQGMSEPTASLNLNDDQAALNLNQDMSRNYSKSQSFNSPFLNDDNDEELDQFLENNANVPQRSDSTKPSMIQSRQQSLRLDDVLKTNPLETEAETLILNAIEARERASTASSLLNNVTSEGASVFNTVRGKSGSIGSQSEVDKRNTISGNVDDHDVKSSLSNTNSANDPNQAANHIRNLSKDSMSTKGSMRGDLSGLRKRTFSKESVSTRGELSPGILGRGTTSGTSTSHSIPMDHRRMHTMEQTLAGLMDAITGIHDVEDGNRNSAYHQPEETLIGGEKTMGVAGTLAQNANLIYRGNKPPKLQSQPSIKHIQTNSFDSSTPTAAAHWGTLKQAVHSSSFEAMEKLKKSEITSDEEAGQRKDKYFEENGEPPQPMASSPNSYPMDDHDKAQGGGTTRKKRFVGRFVDTAKQTNGALSDFCIFMVERQASLLIYIRVLIGLIGPALGVAFFLFYAADNPPTGRVDFEATAASNGTLTNHLGKPIDKDAASISWWILFICVRQVFTFSVSKALEVFIIDFLCLSTRVMVTIFGNLLTLFIVQSKGWPFLLLMWSVLNAGLLHGQNKFVKHWLYWQDPISIFNEENPRYVTCYAHGVKSIFYFSDHS